MNHQDPGLPQLHDEISERTEGLFEATRSSDSVTLREVTVTKRPGVVVSDAAVSVLTGILEEAGLTEATITSGVRTSSDQARVMFQLIENSSVAAAKELYGSNGDQVIDVYVAQIEAGSDPDTVRAAMRDKIVQLGPSRVSRHCSDTHDVMDVAPSTIGDRTAFETALTESKADGHISLWLGPPSDPAYHIEIRKHTA
ncbi:MAG: hypothetical protein KTR31_04040 [Myxococcales bacterium]|nr:hypothetical protein [Myxococcales bacterium]